MSDKVTFSDLGLSEDLLQALTKKGFEYPTPVQEQTIPLLLSGEKDIIGQAQTGTGKTAAFGLPILEGIEPGLHKVQAIVVAPTRELANQVATEINSFKAGRDIRILPVYGGQGMGLQLKELKRGIDIVVGTPGRIIDHLKRKTLKLDHIKFVVLDEADEMLNMGFIEDIEEILSFCPDGRRMLLFSATMPNRIKKLAEKFMGDYDIVRIKSERPSAETVEQIYYSVYEKDKLRALRRLIDTEPEFYALVFCRTRMGSDRLAEKLNHQGFDVAALHGDVSQAQRERILAKFKRGHTTILVATDVAARGIDINNLTHVINFDLPDSPEPYVHRIGRTGRAGKKGIAISFVAPRDRRKLRLIQNVAKATITKKTFPSGEEVLELKKKAMKEQVFLSVENEIPQEFYDLAQDILETAKPKQMLAAVLNLHFGDKLNPSFYPEITDPDSGRGSRSGGGGRSRDRRDRGDRRGGGRGYGGGGGRRSSDRKRSFSKSSRDAGSSGKKRFERKGDSGDKPFQFKKKKKKRTRVKEFG